MNVLEIESKLNKYVNAVVNNSGDENFGLGAVINSLANPEECMSTKNVASIAMQESGITPEEIKFVIGDIQSRTQDMKRMDVITSYVHSCYKSDTKMLANALTTTAKKYGKENDKDYIKELAKRAVGGEFSKITRDGNSRTNVKEIHKKNGMIKAINGIAGYEEEVLDQGIPLDGLLEVYVLMLQQQGYLPEKGRSL